MDRAWCNDIASFDEPRQISPLDRIRKSMSLVSSVQLQLQHNKAKALVAKHPKPPSGNPSVQRRSVPRWCCATCQITTPERCSYSCWMIKVSKVDMTLLTCHVISIVMPIWVMLSWIWWTAKLLMTYGRFFMVSQIGPCQHQRFVRFVGVDPIRVSRLTWSVTGIVQWCTRVFLMNTSLWCFRMVSENHSQSQPKRSKHHFRSRETFATQIEALATVARYLTAYLTALEETVHASSTWTSRVLICGCSPRWNSQQHSLQKAVGSVFQYRTVYRMQFVQSHLKIAMSKPANSASCWFATTWGIT